MIRRAIRDSPPYAEPLLREEYTEDAKRRNRVVRFRYAISNIPYYVASRVRQISRTRLLEYLCKRILVRYHIPMDLLDSIDSYLDHSVDIGPRLRNRGFSRAVHHLIHGGCVRVDCIEHALFIGKGFDNHIQRFKLIDLENEIHEFRQMIVKCLNSSGWNVISSWDINVIGGITFDHFSCWCI